MTFDETAATTEYGPALPEVERAISKPDSEADASFHERRTSEELIELASKCWGAGSGVSPDPVPVPDEIESGGVESLAVSGATESDWAGSEERLSGAGRSGELCALS